jgi:mono/diheme cytochrome c family protein
MTKKSFVILSVAQPRHPAHRLCVLRWKRTRGCVIAALALLFAHICLFAQSPGAESYANHCAICHGDQREGILPAFPPLIGIGRQLTDAQITVLVRDGKGRMPGFAKLPQVELAALLKFLATPALVPTNTHPSGPSEAGRALFQQNCAFCHGRDAMGGETGPDLTRSKLVLADVAGDKISEVVRNGRPEKKMPAFNFSSEELLGVAAFIHDQVARAALQKGARRGVDVADLQTGNVEAGRAYFNGAGTCARCHSPTGDLAGIASRYEGLQLEERMLAPRDAKNHVSVTLPSGKKIAGILAYLDEFTVGLRDANGNYHSWPIANVKYTVDAPVHAHADLYSKYTDADIHNLMAYIQTLK